MANLPEEILLEILRHAEPTDLWLSARQCSRQMKRCVEELFATDIIKGTTADISFSLGNGLHHRWYDIRSTLNFSFQHMHPVEQDWAVFDVCEVRPASCRSNALAKWRDLCLEDKETVTPWQVQLVWRIRCVDLVHHVSLHVTRMQGSEDSTAILLDWRRMYTRFFAEARRSRHAIEPSQDSGAGDRTAIG